MIDPTHMTQAEYAAARHAALYPDHCLECHPHARHDGAPCEACDEAAQLGLYAPCQTVDHIPAGAEPDDDPEALAEELVAEYAAAIERVRDRAEEARAGAARMRRLAQPDAVDWRDCDRWNGPDDPADRYMEGQARDRRWRAERDAHDDTHNPYRPDDRPFPILDAARRELAARRAERMAAR